MKTIKITLFALTALVLGTTTSCKKDKTPVDETPVVTYGTMNVELEHVWGMTESNFALNTNLYHPMTQDTLNFSMFKYYISNFKLKKADGSYWVHPESYFLVDLSDLTTATLNFDSIPSGSYTDIEFTLGVDSTRNVSGAQSGALAISNQMFWSWNSGYIMVRAEGTSPQSTATNNAFAFHLGGFAADKNIVTKKSISLGSTPLNVSSTKTGMIHMKVNPAKLWHASPVSVSTTNTIHMPGTSAVTMATSFYNNTFSLHHVE